jgi:hypothetical protein
MNPCNFNIDGTCAVRGIECSERCYDVNHVVHEACIEDMALRIDRIRDYLGQRGQSDTKKGILSILEGEKAP